MVNKVVDITDMTYEERKNARDEARVLEVLNHPNIIRFHDVFKVTRKDAKKMYLNIVMEYADDDELAVKIKNKKDTGSQFSEDEILNYFT